MANISIKDVPDSMAEALRQRAARNHRSLQGELMAILEQSLVQPSMKDAPEVVSREVRMQRLFAILDQATSFTAADRLSREEANQR
jgi:plasmid stability protein